MKITFVMDRLSLSGGCRVVAVYAELFREMGHEVAVVARHDGIPSLKNILKSLISLKLPEFNRVVENHFEGISIPIFFVSGNKVVCDDDVPDGDVVIATWWETAEWVSKLSHRKGKKVFFIQGYEIFDLDNKLRVEETYKLPLYKIVVSNWLSSIFKEKYKDFSHDVVLNGVDTEFFSGASERGRGQQQMFTVGFIYNGSHIKGTDIIIEAINKVLARRGDVSVKVFGADPLLDNMPLPSVSEFFLAPSQEFIRSIYCSCDVWLFGSREEGFGLPILESMACGTPVIATPAGAAPDLIKKGGGILVRPDDPESMAEAILRVADMEEKEWKLMSDAARVTAISHSWKDAAKKYEAILLRFLEQ